VPIDRHVPRARPRPIRVQSVTLRTLVDSKPKFPLVRSGIATLTELVGSKPKRSRDILSHSLKRRHSLNKRYILCRKYLRCHTSWVNLSNQMYRPIDLTGRKFGKWVVLPRDGFELNHQDCRWLVQCECGRLRRVAGQDLLDGCSSSCGCAPRRKNGNGNGKTSVRGEALRTRLQRVMNQLRPKGTGPKSEGAWESGFIDEDTQSDFWFD